MNFILLIYIFLQTNGFEKVGSFNKINQFLNSLDQYFVSIRYLWQLIYIFILGHWN